MADQKDKAKEKKNQEASADNQHDENELGYGTSGGNMGAGRSGKENLGSEKPTDGEDVGSQQPDVSGSRH